MAKKALSIAEIAKRLTTRGYAAYREDDGSFTVVPPSKRRWIVTTAAVSRGRHFRSGKLEGSEHDTFRVMSADPANAFAVCEAIAGGSSQDVGWADIL